MSGTLLSAVERFLLPNCCVACERAVEPHRPDGLLCGVCRTRLHLVGSAGCVRCRQPLPPIGPCRFCADWPAALDGAVSAVWLDGPARALVHHLKYEGYPAVADEMASLIARAWQPRRAAALIPIPLTRRRFRERGYNQAAALARALAGRWYIPLFERGLTRTRETGTQTALTPAERARNVRDAFRAEPLRARARPGATVPAVILVDDVLTTGATLGAAATALHEAGWSQIRAVTFARALPFELRIGR